MAIRFDAAGDAVGRMSGVVPGAAHTASLWFYLVSDVNATGTIWEHSPTGDGAAFSGVYFNASGTQLFIETSGTDSAATTINVGQWYHLAYRRNGSAHSLFIDGALSQSVTQALTADTSPYMLIGGNGAVRANGRFAYASVYDSALTDAQIAQLAASGRPRVGNPWAFYPLFTASDLKDYSGNGRDLSVLAGTITTEDGPPVTYGAPILTVSPVTVETVEGTLATTNANDTSAASGTTTVAGTLARTNANDTSAAAGTTTVTGTLVRTNADDTSAASGSIGEPVEGELAYTNADDTSAASGTTTVVGTSARTNADDTGAASGTTTVTGSVDATNADDTAEAEGASGLDVIGSVNATNAADTSEATGTTTVVGSSATTNADDTSAATGTTTVTGSSDTTNADDTLEAQGIADAVSGSADVTNGNDTSSASGSAGDVQTMFWGLRRKKKPQEPEPEVVVPPDPTPAPETAMAAAIVKARVKNSLRKPKHTEQDEEDELALILSLA